MDSLKYDYIIKNKIQYVMVCSCRERYKIFVYLLKHLHETGKLWLILMPFSASAAVA